MKPAHFAKLWVLVGAVLLYWAANSMIVFTGGQPILDVDLIYETRIPAQIIALHVLPVLIIVQSWIGLRYAQKAGSGSWASRMPVTGLEGLDFQKREARAYQGIFLAAFLILPVAIEIDFLVQLKDVRILESVEDEAVSGRHRNRDTSGPTTITAAFQRALAAPSWPDNSHSVSETFPLEQGEYVTWFPVLSPAVIGILALVSLGMALCCVVALFADDQDASGT